MIIQDFYLPAWDWHVMVYYEASASDADEIGCNLGYIGCNEWRIANAIRLITSKKVNYGVTYSNFKKHESVMVIGKTTSADEFENSYDHEKGHLVKHICLALGISPWGEEAEYLAGAIGQKTFLYAKHFLCEHCRTRNT